MPTGLEHRRTEVLFLCLLYIFLILNLTTISGMVSCPQTHYPRDMIAMDHSGLVWSYRLLKTCIFVTYRITNDSVHQIRSTHYNYCNPRVYPQNVSFRLRCAVFNQPRFLDICRAGQVCPRAVPVDGTRVGGRTWAELSACRRSMELPGWQ